MGMYTGHRLALRLAPDTPVAVLDVLRSLLLNPDAPRVWPERSFFEQERHRSLFESHDSDFNFDHHGGDLTQDGHGWLLTHTGSSKRGKKTDCSDLADWLGEALLREEGHLLAVSAFEENQQQFEETDVAIAFGNNGYWNASHCALMVSAGRLEWCLKEGDLTQARLSSG